MSVYKEAVHAVNLIRSKSRQVWNDSADFGVPVKKGDDVWNQAKLLVDWYGVKGTRNEHNYATGTTVSQKVSYMPNEHSSGRYVEVEVVFVTVRNNKHMDGIVYINE